MKYLSLLFVSLFAATVVCGKEFDAGAFLQKNCPQWNKKAPEIKFPAKVKKAELDRRLNVFKKQLAKFAPHILKEFAQVDKSFKWQPDTYAKMMLFGFKKPKSTHECTSWIIMPDLLENRSMIVHKNRDSLSRDLNLIRVAVPGKKAWISLGNRGYITANMGFNEDGLAVMMNNGGWTKYNNVTGFGTTLQCRILLESCSTAASAVKLLKEMISAGAYLHSKSGSIWFIGDSRQAFIVEHNAKNISVQEIKSGFAVRANSCHSPELVVDCTQSVHVIIDNLRRERAIWKTIIANDFQKNGKVSLPTVFAASRSREVDGGTDRVYPPFGKATNSASTFVLDREFPADLSTAYFACGPQRHTVYIPCPVTLKVIPEALLHGKFIDAVFARSNKKGLDAPVDEFIALEKILLANHNAAVEKARKILRAKGANARAEAAAVLNDSFVKNWNIVNKQSK